MGQPGHVQILGGLVVQGAGYSSHPFFSPSRSVAYPSCQRRGKKRLVALAAVWMPWLLFLATCSFRQRKKPLRGMSFHPP